MERSSSWQAQTDTYLASLNVTICGNDYTASALQVVRNLFASPTVSNPDPRPVFVAINCLTNSPSRRYREVLINEFYNGGGAQDFTTSIGNWRTVMDAVQAPPALLSNISFTNGAFGFTFPGQRGRNNRVECTTNFLDWTTITNVTGTNLPALIRDLNAGANPLRFYRVARQ